MKAKYYVSDLLTSRRVIGTSRVCIRCVVSFQMVVA